MLGAVRLRGRIWGLLCGVQPCGVKNSGRYSDWVNGGAPELTTINEIKGNLQELVQSRTSKAYDSIVLDLLQSCGPDLIAYTQQERHQLLDRVWMSLLKARMLHHPVYYNRLLQLFMADDHHLSPSDFLDSMEANDVKPNPKTLALILESYCKTGQMEQARVVLNHFKSIGIEIDKETNKAVYKSLSIGMALTNDLDSMQSVFNSMVIAGISPDYDYYHSLLATLAQSGNVDTVDKILDKMLNQDLHPCVSTFKAILNGLACGNHVDAIPMMFSRMKYIVWKPEDFRKLAVLWASRGQFDASFQLLHCLSEHGALQVGTLSTATHLVLNHIVSYCKQDTNRLVEMINKVIGLGVPSNEAFEYLLFNNQLFDCHMEIVKIMWHRGDPIRSVYLYHALGRYVKGDEFDKIHQMLELLRDTGLGADAVILQYLGKYVDKKTQKSKNIITLMEILKKYKLLDIDTTVLSLYDVVVEEWRLPEYFITQYDSLPKATRNPEHLAQLLSQVVHYERSKLLVLPELYQILYADITDHEDFVVRILQMFFLGLVESYPISTTISVINRFIEMGMEDCISQVVFSCVSYHIRSSTSAENDELKNFVSWMISTGRWETSELSKLRSAQHHGKVSRATVLFNELKHKGKLDRLAYSYYIMALSTDYRIFHEDINNVLQECYDNNVRVLTVAVTKLLLAILSSKDLKAAEKVLRDAQNYFGYKPGAAVLSKLARSYSHLGDVNGVLKCNEDLRLISTDCVLESYNNLAYAFYKVQGQVNKIVTLINEMQNNGHPISSNIVSCLIRTYCNSGDIPGAVKAYYETSNLASPKKSVFRSLLDKCVADNDKIITELVMNALIHFGAHTGYVKTSLVFAHLQAGQLDKARDIVKTERIKFLGVKRCMNAAITWYHNNNLDAIVGLLMLCHEYDWPFNNNKVDIKELLVAYYHSKNLTNTAALKAYDSLITAGVSLPPVLHKIIKKL